MRGQKRDQGAGAAVGGMVEWEGSQVTVGDEIQTANLQKGMRLAHICLGRNIPEIGTYGRRRSQECMAELEVRGQLGWTTHCLGTVVIKGPHNG